MRLFLYFIILLFVACTADTPSQGKSISKESFPKNTTIEVKDTLIALPVPIEKSEPEVKDNQEFLLDYDSTQWTDIGLLAPSIVLDLKYATTDNFVKTQMYDCARCFLRPPVARRILAIHQLLQKQGYGLKMFDCYRPRPIQQKLWDKVPDPRYVANPAKGSMHNRGGAVDLTIIDAKGEELDMGTGFDYFGPEAYHTYTKHSEEIAQNRKLLKETMEKFGFRSIRTEWWHYSLGGTGYPLDDMVWACE